MARTETSGGEEFSARRLRSKGSRSRCVLLPWLALLLVAALASGCNISLARERSPTATPTASPTNTATETHTPRPTSTPPPTPSPLPSPTAPPAPVSQVLPEARPAAPPVRSSGPSVPAGTTVVWGGCASDGECHWYNFYWARTHEAVMQYGESQIKVQHELCHAHQHLMINGGAPLRPSDYDLESWYSTAEGASFSRAVAGLAWPWDHSAVNGLEDFAWTCAYWYGDPGYLQSVSPQRYTWARANLP